MRGLLRRSALIGLLTGLSVVGAFVKIPSVLGTPALDSLPGYFAAAAIGLPEGLLVAALGHFATAATVGFPLTIGVHSLVALLTAGAVVLFGLAARMRKPVVAVAVAVIANGVLAPAVLTLIPGFGMAFFAAIVPSLVVASGINAGLAAVLHRSYVRRPWF